MRTARRTDRGPEGDQNGHHRREDRRTWTYRYYPILPALVRPFDIILDRTKQSTTSLPIIYFSSSDGKRAWFSHAGQILDDGRWVSEALIGGITVTPLEAMVRANERGDIRLTIVRLKDGLFYDAALRAAAYESCMKYHASIQGKKYEIPQLFRMMLVSIARNSNPFFKRGKWYGVPMTDVMICSAIVDAGWRYLQEKLGMDLFPSSLSATVPSPQDIWDSPATEFVCGWKREYTS